MGTARSWRILALWDFVPPLGLPFGRLCVSFVELTRCTPRHKANLFWFERSFFSPVPANSGIDAPG
jgi:hypothetical protein